MSNPLKTSLVKEQALTLGFDDVGITKATIPAPDKIAYREYIEEGRQGDLTYMKNEVRLDLNKLLPGAKSAIMLLSYYKAPQVPFSPDKGVVASYARGRDYHNVHRSRLRKLTTWLEEVSGEKALGFSDAHPVLERTLAVQAGLGWFGKSNMLIHRKFGTYTLLAGVLTTLDLDSVVCDTRQRRCGSCTRCIDACPTGALKAPYCLDTRRCLSYHLIESKKPIPKNIQEKNPGFIFGCDICQQVCPHNARKPLSENKDFSSEMGVGPYITAEDLEKEKESLYGTPLQRRKMEGLRYSASTLFDANGYKDPS